MQILKEEGGRRIPVEQVVGHLNGWRDVVEAVILAHDGDDVRNAAVSVDRSVHTQSFDGEPRQYRVQLYCARRRVRPRIREQAILCRPI